MEKSPAHSAPPATSSERQRRYKTWMHFFSAMRTNSSPSLPSYRRGLRVTLTARLMHSCTCHVANRRTATLRVRARNVTRTNGNVVRFNRMHPCACTAFGRHIETHAVICGWGWEADDISKTCPGTARSRNNGPNASLSLLQMWWGQFGIREGNRNNG